MTRRQRRPNRAAPDHPAYSSDYPAVAWILDSLPFGVVLLTGDGTIDGINTEGARLLGRVPSSLFGQSFPRLWSDLTGSDSDAIRNQLKTVAASRQPMPLTTTRLRHGPSSLIPVQWTCQAIDRGGCSTRARLAISLRDLSREEELREERDRLAAIAEETPSPIIELNRDGHMVYANPAMTAWLATLGYRDDGIPSMLPPDLPSLVAQCLQTGKPLQGREVSLAGATFSWTFCPVIPHGLVRGYAIDLTSVYKAQQELIETAEQLQEANKRLDEALTAAQEAVKAKARFLATMSHELRTPMNGVIGMTSLLMDTALSAEQRTYTETIRLCGESLLHVINDVLEYSKIEAGKLELECIDFNLRTAVEQILAQFAKQADMAGIELMGLVHATVPMALRGDPARLRQVLSNLVGNALKFTEKGEVTLQASLERDDHDSALIRFEVTDTGIGISPDVQAKLFQPFVQGDSSTTRKYGGTGLGLTIAKQLIELMGGQIGVASAVGHGSTFWCTARFSTQADSPPAIVTSKELAGRRVLIVDDNKSSRMILHHLVTGWGMTADLAEDATAALRYLAEAAARGVYYDAAIIDSMMPGTDGLQLARECFEHPPGTKPGIVLLTSMVQQNQAAPALPRGAVDFLPKPVCHDPLHASLCKVMKGGPIAEATVARSADPAFQASTGGPPPQITAPATPILIVEDNEINQKLIVRLVEKLGYRPHVTANGQEALAALERGDYALILMDCQMPVLDGYETTRIIRQREGANQTGQSGDKRPQGHIPIIAVTANAMQGDRERCLAAGMDDYLAKPIHLDRLRAVLQRWTQPVLPSSRDTQQIPTAGSDEQDIFDAAKMFQNIGEDHQLFRQLVALFLDRHQTMLDKIKEGLAKSDAHEVERAAHTLKGTVGNLCATSAMSAASQLEALGRSGLLQDAPAVYATLETEILRLARVLDRYRHGYEPLPKAA